MRRTIAACLLATLLASSCATAKPRGTALSGTLNATGDPTATGVVPDGAVDLTGSAQVTVVAVPEPARSVSRRSTAGQTMAIWTRRAACYGR